jgi:hypothetical protein
LFSAFGAQGGLAAALTYRLIHLPSLPDDLAFLLANTPQEGNPIFLADFASLNALLLCENKSLLF